MDSLNDRQWRRVGAQGTLKGVQRVGGTFQLQLQAGSGVAGPSVQGKGGGQPVDKGAKAYPLDNALNEENAVGSCVGSQRGAHLIGNMCGQFIQPSPVRLDTLNSGPSGFTPL